MVWNIVLKVNLSCFDEFKEKLNAADEYELILQNRIHPQIYSPNILHNEDYILLDQNCHMWMHQQVKF